MTVSTNDYIERLAYRLYTAAVKVGLDRVLEWPEVRTTYRAMAVTLLDDLLDTPTYSPHIRASEELDAPTSSREPTPYALSHRLPNHP